MIFLSLNLQVNVESMSIFLVLVVGVCRVYVECGSGVGYCVSSTCLVYVEYQVLESGSDAPFTSNICRCGMSSGADATGYMSNN